MDKCPKCGSTDIHRDEVDIGVGIQYGPYGCATCGWSEWEEYDFSDGKSRVAEDGGVWDQYGGYYPASSPFAKLYRDNLEHEENSSG